MPLQQPGPDDTSGDDADTPRPRWLAVLLVLTIAVLAVGLLISGWLIMQPRPPAAGASAPAASGLALVQANHCMRCHQAERTAVGPSYRAIAERHASSAEAVALLATKIRQGSVGDWGRVIMPRHPQVNEADARQMAQWVLAQRPAPL